MTKHKYEDGERVYIVYEARAAGGDTDEAGILESFSAASDGKAKQDTYRLWHGTPYVLYGCTFKDGLAIEDDAPLARHRC